MRPFLQTLWLEIRSQFSEVASWFWGKRSLFMISLILFGLAAFFTVPHDKAWVRDVKGSLARWQSLRSGSEFLGRLPIYRADTWIGPRHLWSAQPKET